MAMSHKPQKSTPSTGTSNPGNAKRHTTIPAPTNAKNKVNVAGNHGAPKTPPTPTRSASNGVGRTQGTGNMRGTK